jgi:hypothetical protein
MPPESVPQLRRSWVDVEDVGGECQPCLYVGAVEVVGPQECAVRAIRGFAMHQDIGDSSASGHRRQLCVTPLVDSARIHRSVVCEPPGMRTRVPLYWEDVLAEGTSQPVRGDTREMQSSHAATTVDIVFDDPNLIADAGLVPVLALAEQIGLPDLVDQHLVITDADNSAGANPVAKVMSLLAGMVAGADSIDDMDRLRQAGNTVVFDRIRAPSTLGAFLRAFTHGHVQQLNAVLRRALIALAQRVPLLPGAQEVVFVDLDSTHRQVYGYAKQGAQVGRLKGKKTLHPLIATASTPISRPVMVARSGCGRASPPTCAGRPDSWPKPWPRCARSRPPRRSWCARTPSSTPPTWWPPRPATTPRCR